MTSRITLMSAMLLAGCAHVEPRGQSAAPPPALRPSPPLVGVTARNSIVPLLDAHQRMMGAAAMTTLSLPPSPEPVAVPAPVAELLAQRERGVDEASYDALFTADAQVFAEAQGRWWTGRSHVLKAVAEFGAGRRFIPTSFAATGSSGYVAGILRPTAGEDSHNFVLGIRKDAGGRWRIASEMKQPIMPRVYAPMVDADRIIEVLDDAGIRYATVLSTGYWFGNPERLLEEKDRVAGTRAENDWVIAQARRFPERLIPFCGVNPVADYAIAEMERCHGLGIRGMKIHGPNSRYAPGQPADRERLQLFFRTANRLGMAIVLHLTRDGPQEYIDHIFPEAPDIPIQIAHMASGWKNAEMFADAIEAGRPGTKNLWFDWTQALRIPNLWTYGPGQGTTIQGGYPPEFLDKVVAVMRRIGLDRILYGSDMPLAWNPNPREWWRKTILTLPLTDQEIANIADNIPPYVPR